MRALERCLVPPAGCRSLSPGIGPAAAPCTGVGTTGGPLATNSKTLSDPKTLIGYCMRAVYEDTLNGCPQRSTSTASINDATSISSTNPRPYRPGPLTPLDGNSATSQPLNSTFDPW